MGIGKIVPFLSLKLYLPPSYSVVLDLLSLIDLDPLFQNLDSIAHRLLGKSVYINWPHMEEAKVLAVSDGKVKVRMLLLLLSFVLSRLYRLIFERKT